MNELFLHMKSHPGWEAFEQMLKQQRPVLPVFDPRDDNSEVWKVRSSEQVGYDKVLTFLEIGE